LRRDMTALHTALHTENNVLCSDRPHAKANRWLGWRGILVLAERDLTPTCPTPFYL